MDFPSIIDGFLSPSIAMAHVQMPEFGLQLKKMLEEDLDICSKVITNPLVAPLSTFNALSSLIYYQTIYSIYIKRVYSGCDRQR